MRCVVYTHYSLWKSLRPYKWAILYGQPPMSALNKWMYSKYISDEDKHLKHHTEHEMLATRFKNKSDKCFFCQSCIHKIHFSLFVCQLNLISTNIRRCINIVDSSSWTQRTQNSATRVEANSYPTFIFIWLSLKSHLQCVSCNKYTRRHENDSILCKFI